MKKYESKLNEKKVTEAVVSFNTKDSSREALQEVITHMAGLYSNGVNDLKFISAVAFALTNSISKLAHEQDTSAMKVFKKIFNLIKARL